MKKTTLKPIADRTWQGQQSWNRQIIETIGDRKVRLTVKVDSYDFQSSAKAELWNGEKWHTIHHIPGQAVRAFKRISSAARTCDPAVFDDDVTELRTVARAVLS